MTLRTPLSTVRGLGAAKDGTAHFWQQRLTAIANIPLAVAFVAIVISIGGADYAQARALVASPVVAVTVLLLVVSATYHMRLGIQVIVEDYVHGEGLKIAALLASTFFSVVIAVGCAFAILKISLGG